MKQEHRRTLILGGIAIVGLGVAAFLFFGPQEDEIPKVEDGTIYYTGPMKSKTPGRNEYGTLGGGTMTEAEAKAAAEKWKQDNLTKN